MYYRSYMYLAQVIIKNKLGTQHEDTKKSQNPWIEKAKHCDNNLY